MPRPINPSPYKTNLASCEVCWADSSETNIYHFKGSTYCEYDLSKEKEREGADV